MSAADSPFRGYQGIAEIVTRLRPLAEFFLRNRDNQSRHGLTLARRDYDLIRRWPKAAEMHEFTLAPDGTLLWHGFVLTPDGGCLSGDFAVRPDNGKPRYAERA